MDEIYGFDIVAPESDTHHQSSRIAIPPSESKDKSSMDYNLLTLESLLVSNIDNISSTDISH